MENKKPAVSTKLQPKRGFKKFLLTLAAGTLLIGGGMAYWEYFCGHGNYDKGTLLKLSLKGNFIQTYEGVINRRMGQAGYSDADTFFFSVADKLVALQLEKAIGKVVIVHYIKYRAPLPWRGDNYNGRNLEDGQYMVDSLIKVDTGAKDF
jgi:hypothetical protein